MPKRPAMQRSTSLDNQKGFIGMKKNIFKLISSLSLLCTLTTGIAYAETGSINQSQLFRLSLLRSPNAYQIVTTCSNLVAFRIFSDQKYLSTPNAPDINTLTNQYLAQCEYGTLRYNASLVCPIGTKCTTTPLIPVTFSDLQQQYASAQSSSATSNFY